MNKDEVDELIGSRGVRIFPRWCAICQANVIMKGHDAYHNGDKKCTVVFFAGNPQDKCKTCGQLIGGHKDDWQ